MRIRGEAMKTIAIIWLLVMGFILGPAVHEAYVWHQVEKQALAADLVEGDQS
jgi:hypothetical protein